MAVADSWQEEKKEGGEEEEEVKVDTFKFIGVRRLKGECLVRKASGFLGLLLCSGGNLLLSGLDACYWKEYCIMYIY